MKTKLEFTFDEEDSADEIQMLMKRTDLYLALWDMSQYLREQYKYIPEEKQDSLEVIREKFYEILSDRDITEFF